jgi:chemotaxis family two-component system response regulator Rcp1
MTSLPCKIILMEDNAGDEQILRRAFDRHGQPYVLEVLADGEAASRYLQDAEKSDAPRPALIIVDLHFPDCDGTSLLRALRVHPVLSGIPVAVLTASASPLEHKEVLAHGVSLYRTKPMNWDETLRLGSDLLALCPEPQAAG